MANHSLWTSCLTATQPVALPWGCGNLSKVSNRVMHVGVSMCVDKQATVDKFATLLAHFNAQVCVCVRAREFVSGGEGKRRIMPCS